MNAGRFVGFSASPTSTAASGIWTIGEARRFREQSLWPTAATSPPVWAPEPALLLHFDGADQADTTTDSSIYSRSVTLNGNAVISTAQSKFGGSSLLLDGDATSVATIPAALDIQDRDWTVDAWVYLDADASGTYAIICEIGDHVSDAHDGIGIGLLGDEGWRPAVFRSVYEDYFQSYVYTASNGPEASIEPETWTHVAWTRAGGTLRVFVDGVVDFEDSGFSVVASSNVIAVGGTAEGVEQNVFAGHIDELRILVGRAKWTAAFTPPTQAYV